MEILVKRDYTVQEVAKALEHPGKKRGLTAGSWVHDLCALRKVITLCPLCTHKFNPGRLGYIHDKDIGQVQASCDGCKTFDTCCNAYFFEETFKSVRSTAADRRSARTVVRSKPIQVFMR